MIGNEVIGAINFACGTRVPYDDRNPQHRRRRLHRKLPALLVDCPQHGPEKNTYAVSGPAELLWPDLLERRAILRELARERMDVDCEPWSTAA